eukprot:TRINITY_DN1137_c0_g1_i1.p1 TRINITY_DN1137_c0_g1~~TRINITY_DN1137_c0_g1_i1.p1  ORF type:complete len:160 (-),score=17.11 TRINITY_DN1137_c0_g1_i1:538-1017(-)
MARIKPKTLLLQSKKKGPTRISITNIVICNLIVVLVVISLVATYRHLSQRSSNRSGDDPQTFEDIEAFGELKKFNPHSYAILNTSKGLITVELYKEASPEIVDKFLDLCQKGYFNGMLFNNVIKNYVIQGGDSQTRGAAEDWLLRGKSNRRHAIRKSKR